MRSQATGQTGVGGAGFFKQKGPWTPQPLTQGCRMRSQRPFMNRMWASRLCTACVHHSVGQWSRLLLPSFGMYVVQQIVHSLGAPPCRSPGMTLQVIGGRSSRLSRGVQIVAALLAKSVAIGGVSLILLDKPHARWRSRISGDCSRFAPLLRAAGPL